MQLDALKSAWHSEGSTGHTELCKEALRFMATCTSAQVIKCYLADLCLLCISARKKVVQVVVF